MGKGREGKVEEGTKYPSVYFHNTMDAYSQHSLIFVSYHLS